MKFNNLSAIALLLATSCGVKTAADAGGASTVNPGGTASVATASGPNVMALTVDGANCGSSMYINKPCVSVTICSPGTTNCVTINDVLLDTGSYGLRVFKTSVQNLSLTREVKGGNPIGECTGFADGSTTWGPVEIADVVMGGEPAVNVPIQVIDSTFANGGNCGTPVASPADAQFHAILGVGVLPRDCGDECATMTDNQMYFSCAGSNCVGTTLPTSYQVTNPVAKLPIDNNGVVIQLPAVDAAGLGSVTGNVIIGIGTRSNNMPTGVTTYPADATTGRFQTSYNGTNYVSFLDTGSNGISVPSAVATAASLPDCGDTDSSYAGWLCPANPQSLAARNIASDKSASATVTFSIANFINLYSSNRMVFSNNVGVAGQDFDWGLPFFYGRSVYVGLESNTTGPYWAY